MPYAQSSSRSQLSSVKESTVGTTPASPRMWLRRPESFNLRANGIYATPGEIRADRAPVDAVLVGKEAGASITYSVVPFNADQPIAVDLEGLLYSTWVRTPERVKDGTVSTLTSVTASTNVVAMTNNGTGAFAVRHLVRFSGFANAANNGIKLCTTGGTTSATFSSGNFVTETAPVGSRAKVVGFMGASGDITATATGLGCTSLDFTTLGLRPGDWIKIGGELTGERFATSALNCFARIVSIAATALTLDHLPTQWTTDTGTSKTIVVWIGDTISNGFTQSAQTFQEVLRDLLTAGESVKILAGLTPGDGTISGEMNQPLKMSLNYDGLGATLPSGLGTVANLDSSPESAGTQTALPVYIPRIHTLDFKDPQTTYLGVTFATTAQHLRSFRVAINNNQTRRETMGVAFASGLTAGLLSVTGEFTTYFDINASNTAQQRDLSGTAGSIAVVMCNRVSAGSNVLAGQSPGMVISVPRVKFMRSQLGAASGVGQDVMNSYTFQASVDESVAAQADPGSDFTAGRVISITNFEYVAP